MQAFHDKLTILLPLKDKEPFTWRWLSWAQECAMPYVVLIADGGTCGLDLRLLERFPNLRLQYIRYPFDASLLDFYAKMADALGRVATPYTAVASNDDFLSSEGLQKCVDFLDAHPGYVAAAGDQQDFVIRSGPRSHLFVPHYGEFVVGDQCYPAKSLEQDTVFERMVDYVNNHFNSFLWGGVLRTRELTLTWDTISKSDIDDLRFALHLFYLLPITCGKIRRIPGLYGLHQANPGGSYGASMLKSHPTWGHWMQNSSWEVDFQKFAFIIGGAIAATDRTNSAAALSNFANLYLGSFGRDMLANTWPETSKSFFPPMKTEPLDKEHLELQRLTEFLLAPQASVADLSPISCPPEKVNNRIFSTIRNLLQRKKKVTSLLK
jgi:glycosyltransferase domain-containing protein